MAILYTVSLCSTLAFDHVYFLDITKFWGCIVKLVCSHSLEYVWCVFWSAGKEAYSTFFEIKWGSLACVYESWGSISSANCW